MAMTVPALEHVHTKYAQQIRGKVMFVLCLSHIFLCQLVLHHPGGLKNFFLPSDKKQGLG